MAGWTQRWSCCGCGRQCRRSTPTRRHLAPRTGCSHSRPPGRPWPFRWNCQQPTKTPVLASQAFFSAKASKCHSFLSPIAPVTKTAVLASQAFFSAKASKCPSCPSFLSSIAPVYQSDLLSVYSPSRQPCPSSDPNILCIPNVRTSKFERSSVITTKKHHHKTKK